MIWFYLPDFSTACIHILYLYSNSIQKVYIHDFNLSSPCETKSLSLKVSHCRTKFLAEMRWREFRPKELTLEDNLRIGFI